MVEHTYSDGASEVRVNLATENHLILPGSLEYWLRMVDAECDMAEALLNE